MFNGLRSTHIHRECVIPGVWVMNYSFCIMSAEARGMKTPVTKTYGVGVQGDAFFRTNMGCPKPGAESSVRSAYVIPLRLVYVIETLPGGAEGIPGHLAM